VLPRAGSRDPASRAREKRALYMSLGLAFAIMILEVVGGLLTNSLALLSDAGHMLTDASAMLLSILACSFATRPKDKHRTYGFHRLEILAALANGLILVGLAVTIFYQAYERFLDPPVVDALPMIGWAAVGLVANCVAIYFLAKSRESLNTHSAFLHVLFDTISSVFVIGGGVAMYFTGWFLLDPILSCVLGLLIIYSSVRLGWEATHILLEGVPKGIDVEKVRHAMEEVPGVCAVHDLHIWSITSGMSALSAHVVVRRDALGDTDSILAAVNRHLRLHFPIEHSTLQIESEHYEHVESIC
jgi:cobalt-zinc-cadmium efflux system protein